MRLRRGIRLPLALLAAFVGCDKPVRPSDDVMPAVSVVVHPGTMRLTPGDTVRLSAQARDASGAVVAGMSVVWTSKDLELATVTGGLVLARAPAVGVVEDTTWVVGSVGDLRDSARVVVTDGSVPEPAARMGMNLAPVNDWTTEWPFTNVFHSSRYWISQRTGAAWGQGGALALTPEHWVASLETGQYATTIVLTDATALAQQPGGDYVLLYDGDGELRFEINASVTVLSQSPGRIVARVPPGQNAVFMNLRRTNPADPVRNVRFVPLAAEASYHAQAFTQEFLRVVRPFGVLRFMNWQSTNHTPPGEWALRATRSFATFAGPWGVPVETMVALANETGADPWFCIGHLASDDYVRQFATLVRSQLDPRRRVYVEYSNEVWNSIFPQATYVRDRGIAANLSTNAGQAALRYYSQRAVEIFAIWRQVFGADSARVVRVLASQAANSWTAEQVLSWQDAYRKTDAIAIAPYFGGSVGQGTGATQAAMSETEVLDALAAEMEGPVRGFIDANAQIARQYNVRLVAYEGGQHLVSAFMSAEHEPVVTQKFLAVNRHARMGDLYRRYFEIWYGAGDDLFLPFEDASAWSKFGSWGALENVRQNPATSPKYRAILEAAARFSAATR